MSTTPNFVKLVTLYDPAQAEVLRGLLEAQGIQTLLSKEAAGQLYGTFVGRLGEIELYVPAEHEEAAQALVDAFFAE